VVGTVWRGKKAIELCWRQYVLKSFAMDCIVLGV
jgi:hypothetical protein